MSSYEHLCAMLSPLRVYRLEGESINGAELRAAGEGLDEVADALEAAERDAILMTAESDTLARWEKLFVRCPAAPTAELRRMAVAALLRVGADGFTLRAINETIGGCGIRALAEETGEYGKLRVRFPDVAGEPENFAVIRDIILDILPCHLETEFFLRYLTWEECEAQNITWQMIEDELHTWESFEKAVLPE